ncbi:Zein-binding domain-containing protein [Cynara cardunculus var. scolymus]|uniref:Zein-binding domain-containing protein n=1 Tax=Cynara cardunculus var. scolymus TaxID=59895 RepID=A0A103XVI4_CYNCS|nr:Zein-binding domain-containing protein [Cynara cardunculus var. scolymus]
MAANKFATMLHNNTNKITLILIYALLEWTLILLLLLNSLFSYFIIKFAQFFALNPPCFWCARIDRLFEPRNENSHRNHLCELHSKEVSHLGFCSIHQKLAESQDLCEDCSSSNLGFRRESKKFVFSKVERIDVIQSDGEDEVRLKCSCCDVDFETKFVDDSSCFVIHPLSDILDDAKKENLIDDHEAKIISEEQIESNSIEEKQEIASEKGNDGNEELETEEHEIEIKRDEHSITSANLHSNIENADMKLENFDEIEEEKAPETPSSIYSLNPLHKKWLMPEMKESGTEESFDGSAISETDSGDPVNTSEKLKSALKAERKTLHHLYTELEEERNAAAVAANETMAMINRLQEEKAAMQMEALQYQRMMEEQSEYDHDALQLLNELMMKKQTELELYRKKVLDYESKEKTRFLQRSTKTGTSSVSWSHSEDDDGLSADLNRESQHQNTPIHSVLDLESFEEERVSILEQLKVLEEKLFALSDEEDRHFAKVSVIEDHYEEVANHGVKGPVVEFMQNGRQPQPIGKSLLPLFDAISSGSEDGMTVRNAKFEDTAVTRFELEKKRIDMEEEVDQLYARLQGLEADKEFLKHCIGSMNKGDKGMELLQEILQHLRDLRTRNYNDNAFI